MDTFIREDSINESLAKFASRWFDGGGQTGLLSSSKTSTS
jgi:hypothetical protein